MNISHNPRINKITKLKEEKQDSKTISENFPGDFPRLDRKLKWFYLCIQWKFVENFLNNKPTN